MFSAQIPRALISSKDRGSRRSFRHEVCEFEASDWKSVKPNFLGYKCVFYSPTNISITRKSHRFSFTDKSVSWSRSRKWWRWPRPNTEAIVESNNNIWEPISTNVAPSVLDVYDNFFSSARRSCTTGEVLLCPINLDLSTQWCQRTPNHLCRDSHVLERSEHDTPNKVSWENRRFLADSVPSWGFTGRQLDLFFNLGLMHYHCSEKEGYRCVNRMSWWARNAC